MLKLYCNRCNIPITEEHEERSLAFEETSYGPTSRKLLALRLMPWAESVANFSNRAIHFCSYICQSYYIGNWNWEARGEMAKMAAKKQSDVEAGLLGAVHNSAGTSSTFNESPEPTDQ